MYTNVKKIMFLPEYVSSDRLDQIDIKKKHELFYFSEYSYTWNYINNIIYIHRHTTVTK